MGKRIARRTPKGKQLFVTKAQLKRENHLIENGQRFAPSPHPPDFMAIPWFNLTVRVEDFNSITLGIDAPPSGKALLNELRAQIILSANDVLEYRVQSIRIWGPIVAMNASTALPHLRARFWSLVPQISTQTGSSAFTVLEDISAYPDQVSRASIGFHYPKSQQSIPVQQGNSGQLVTLASGGPTGNVAYVRVLWRPRQSLNTD